MARPKQIKHYSYVASWSFVSKRLSLSESGTIAQAKQKNILPFHYKRKMKRKKKQYRKTVIISTDDIRVLHLTVVQRQN